MTVKTKNGKPVIDRITKIPMYTKSVEQRIKETKQKLGISLQYKIMSTSDRWASIVAHTQLLNSN